MTFYEDFLCPACGNFERTFGPTVSKLIDIGAIAADYSMVAILDSPQNQNYSSRAGAAAYASPTSPSDAFRRFHTALFSTRHPARRDAARSFPGQRATDRTRPRSRRRGQGAGLHQQRQVPLQGRPGEAAAGNITATPTIKINGENYEPSTPDALVAKIKEIVGDVPGIDAAVAPAAA